MGWSERVGQENGTYAKGALNYRQDGYCNNRSKEKLFKR